MGTVPRRKAAARPAQLGSDRLDVYRSKRDFGKTPEPIQDVVESGQTLVYAIQKHAASRLHYDLRLEFDGVLLSWAMPKGPSFDPKQMRMAVRTENHPMMYAQWEGVIPPKQYGAGTMIVWDQGTWEPQGDVQEGLEVGKIVFRLHGQKLAGLWELVRIQKPGEKQEPWMMFKKRDAWAQSTADYDVITALPDSVVSKPLGLVESRSPRTAAQVGTNDRDAEEAERAFHSAPSIGLPASLSPQLATLATELPRDGEWTYEIKFDGYRILARIEAGQVRLFTRNGHDWTDRMVSLAHQIEELDIDSGWLDGEAVVMGGDGLPNFNALQNAFDKTGTESILYFAFDVPFLDGKDLRSLSLKQRRTLLQQRLRASDLERVRFSEAFGGDGASILKSACGMGLEGVMAKRLDAPYELRRSTSWLKLKCNRRQEFVIGGFTDRSDGGREVGSLLLGVYDENGSLRSAGSVGTGWDAKTSSALWKQLVKLVVSKSPFDARYAPTKGRWSRRQLGSERWVQPRLVAEVSFAEWTPDGSVRHAKFEGLRTDKPAADVRREDGTSRVVGTTAPATRSSVKVSNADRVIDPSTGLTKLDLVRYYESVADWILPHLAGRPTSLVRGPTGVGGELFFQKHGDKIGIPGIRELDPSLWPGHAALLEIPTAEALTGAAQINVIEFHTWNAKATHIDKPDRVIFDLDPGEGVTWQQIQEAAVLTRAMLGELGLQCWLKTSGGKGLHLVAPLSPRADYETVNRFSKAVVVHMAKAIPARFVAKSGGGNRVGKIFIDYLRNGHGATTAAAFSARSRPGLGVSMPVAWDDLMTLKGGAHWTITTAREHLSLRRADPWGAYWESKQTLGKAIKRLTAAGSYA